MICSVCRYFVYADYCCMIAGSTGMIRRVPRSVLIFEGLLHVSEQFDHGHLPTVQQLPDPLLQLVRPSKKYACNCTPYLSPLYLNRIVLRSTWRQKPQDDIAFGAFNVAFHLFAGMSSCVVQYYKHSAIHASEILQKCNYTLGIRLLMELYVKCALSQRPYDLCALFGKINLNCVFSAYCP